MPGKISKSILKIAALGFMLGNATTVAAMLYEGPVSLEFCPYVGVQGNMRHMSWASGRGGNLFKKDYPEGDVFLGAKFSEFVGVEVGYQSTTTKYDFASVAAGSRYLGIPTSFNTQALTRARFKGWHGNLVGFLPVYMADCVYVIGSVGFTNFKLFQQSNVLQVNGIPIVLGTATSTFEKRKSVLSLKLGVEIKLDDSSSFRVMTGWDDTSRLKTLIAPDTYGLLRVKNSYTYGLGLIIRFL